MEYSILARAAVYPPPYNECVWLRQMTKPITPRTHIAGRSKLNVSFDIKGFVLHSSAIPSLSVSLHNCSGADLHNQLCVTVLFAITNM